jgi:hypothetical protein
LLANIAFCETGIGAGSLCFVSLHNRLGGSKLLLAQANLRRSFFIDMENDSFRRRFPPEQMSASKARRVKINFSIEGDEFNERKR